MITTQFFTGGLVADPETSTVQSGNMVTNFRIGESDSKSDGNGGRETINRQYLRIVAWDNRNNPLAQIAAQLRKGDQVCVVGKLITRQYTNRDGETKTTTEVNAFHIYEKLTAGAQQGSGQQQGEWNNQQPPQQHQGNTWGQPAPTGQAPEQSGTPPF